MTRHKTGMRNFVVAAICIAATSGDMAMARTDWSRDAAAAEAAGRYREALRLVAIARAADPDDDALQADETRLRDAIDSALKETQQRVDAARRAGDAAGERAALRALLALDPTDTAARDALRTHDRAWAFARIAKTNDQVRLAEEAQRRTEARETAVAAPPNSHPGASDVAPALDAARAALARGDFDDAITALNSDSRSTDERAQRALLARAHASAADAALDAGDKRRALRHYEEQIKASPVAATQAAAAALRRDLADGLFRDGLAAYDADLDRAIALWRQAVSIDPDHAEARIQLDEATAVRDALEIIRAASPSAPR